MNDYTKILLAGLLTFLTSLLIAPAIIKIMQRLKAGQVVLGYVEQHNYKTGTPTMGGWIFILPITAITLIFGYTKLSLVAVAVTVSYAVLGFLDDFLKVKNKQNLGLKAYQKIVGQFGIAIIVAVFCYNNQYIGSIVNVPFSNLTINMRWWYIPFTVFVYLALTNSVNLTDGLDGLASSVSVIYFITFLIILMLNISTLAYYGQALEIKETFGLAVFCASFIGGLLAFLCFNFYPARIMMGDTGSLAIGGGVTSVAVFSKNPFLILLVGIMFVVSCISVIMQVIYYKLTKKRIFLMSPYHHHLEKKGYHEAKITAWYTIITVLMAAITIIAAGVL